MSTALNDVPGRNTPIKQTEQARPDQVVNNAGGYVFQLDDFDRLRRFLILGTEGGTFYVGQRKHTLDNVEVLDRCLAADHERTVRLIHEVSTGGLAPKNDQAIFALAKAASTGSVLERGHALSILPDVCRIGTHLFMFVEFAEKFRGWGPALRNAVGNWFINRSDLSLQTQMAKYGQRNGWSMADLLRLAKPRPERGSAHDRAFGWAVNRAKDPAKRKEIDLTGLSVLGDFERLHTSETAAGVVSVLAANQRLSWEMVPSQFLKSPEVWEALLPTMGLTALIRNLGRLTSIGLIGPFQSANKLVCDRLVDDTAIQAARVHPMQFLLARGQYAMGQGDKGSLTWNPSGPIVQALDEGFLLAFKDVEASNKRTVLALDVSGSMALPTNCIAGTKITAREASAAMAMVTLATEPFVETVAFSSLEGSAARRGTSWRDGTSRGILTPLSFSKRSSLGEMVKTVTGLPFSSTDCALPALWAAANKIDVETIVIYTDSETYAGGVHPYRALEQLRQQLGHDVKQIVVGMTSTGFTIADPGDRSSLDVVGFDASAPALMAEFSAGRV